MSTQSIRVNPFLSGWIDRRLAGCETHYLSPPKDANMRISDRLTKCVGFISLDTNPLKYAGTVFIVSIPYNSHEGLFHIVTAKHVADEVGNANFVIGMNAKDGKAIWIKSGGEGETRWFFHPTEEDSVDVAVMPFSSTNLAFYDLADIPISMFATEQVIAKQQIGLGDELINIGLFTRFFGTTRLTPIVRTGTIAMMPVDKIKASKKFPPMEVYLAEGRSIGGLSGSPVFCRSTMNMPGQLADGSFGQISGLGPLHLLGLMHGHWDLPVQFTEDERERVNMGVSIVVPAKKIIETINHPDLVKVREEAFEKKSAAGYATADFEPSDHIFTEQDFEADLRKVTRRVGTSAPDSKKK